jgi:hypothetical protein
VSKSAQLALYFLPALAILALPIIHYRNEAKAAEIRWEAGEAYREALTESCPPVKAYPRSVVLADARRALAAFEQDHRATAFGDQLRIAEADAKIKLGCWEDNTRSFADQHVRMAHERLMDGLKKLGEIGPIAFEGRAPEEAFSNDAAIFRAAVFEALEAAAPVCDVSTQASNAIVLGDAKAALMAFRYELNASPRAFDYDVAAADKDYRDSIVSWECSEPDDMPVAELRNLARKATLQRIAELRKRL